MITIKRTFCPGRGMIRPEELTGYVFSPEAAAHMFIITKMEKVDGQEAAVPFDAGTDISCRFIKANGVTELVDGDLTDDGAASITLPAECYQVPGRFILSIYAETSEETICIYSATATALAGDTEEINVSGNTKRTIDAQIAALNDAVENAQETVEQVQEVIDSIPQDYTALSDSVSDLKSATGDLNEEVYQFVEREKSVDRTGYTINSNGKLVEDANYNVYGYSVKPGQVLIVTTDHVFGFYSAMNAGGSTPPIIGTLYESGTHSVTAPSDAKFLFVSTLANGSYSVYERFNYGSTVKGAVGGGRYEITVTALDVLDGYWARAISGKIAFVSSTTYKTTNKIDISALKPGTDVLVISSVVNDYGVFIADNGNNVIDYINGSNAESKGITTGSYPQLVSMTVPQNAKYLVTDIRSAYYTDESVFTLTGVKNDNITDMQEEIGLLGADVLAGKKWVACGDSFTAGSFSNSLTNDYIFTSGLYAGSYKVYPFWIGRRNQSLTVINEAISGSTMGGGDGGVNPFSAPTRYQAIPADTDYITLEFGINDVGEVPIGTIDDDDNTTFYGAWNVVLAWLIENRPFAHIGMIIGPGMQTSSGQEYATAEIAIAKKWGIPYLNVQFESGGKDIPLMLRTSNPDVSADAKAFRNAQQYVNPSVETPNYHPNEKAHEYESGYIEAFLRRI